MTLSEAEARVATIKAMVHPVRLLVIEFLRVGEKAFSSLFNLFQLDKSTISRHLFFLRETGIIPSQETGSGMIYRLIIKYKLEKGGTCSFYFQ